jgi:hypothetical protein
MPNPGQTSLTKLFRRMILSFVVAMIGSWGLIIPRLHVVGRRASSPSPDVWLYIDAASLALTLLGVLMLLWYRHLLGPRLRRLETLGESRW